MKLGAGPLLDSYRKRELSKARCAKVTRSDGTVLGFTDHDRTLTIDGVDYEPGTLTLQAVTVQAGLSTANGAFEGAIDSERITVADLQARLYENAAVTLMEVDWSDPSLGAVTLPGSGRVGQQSIVDRIRFKWELRGPAALAQQTITRQISILCRAELGDGLCRVDLAPFTVTGTVTAADPDRAGFTDTARAERDGFFTGGKVTWTSGANEGRTMEVKDFAAGAFSLFEPMPFAIAAGDTYSVYQGCNKLARDALNGCTAFNNLVNFQGEPDLPGLDAIMGGYPNAH